MKKTNQPNFNIQRKENNVNNDSGDIFLSSLNELSANDFPKTEKTADPKTKKQKLLYNGLLILFAGIFVFAGIGLFSNVSDYIKANSIYDDLQNIWNEDPESIDSSRFLSQSVCLRPMAPLNTGGVTTPETEPSTTPTANDHLIIMAKLNRLFALNNDTVGWIKIEGTVIDYPIVQGPDNDFYLRRDFYKNYLNNGSIYLDYKNDKSLLNNQNTVIYGHNMDDGSMFNNVHYFANKSFFESTVITITTKDGVFVYKPFSVHEPLATNNYFHTHFSESKYFDFIKGLKENSFIKNDVTLTKYSKILTLSTCIDTILQSKYRFAVHAKLVSYTGADGVTVNYEAVEQQLLSQEEA